VLAAQQPPDARIGRITGHQLAPEVPATWKENYRPVGCNNK